MVGASAPTGEPPINEYKGFEKFGELAKRYNRPFRQIIWVCCFVLAFVACLTNWIPCFAENTAVKWFLGFMATDMGVYNIGRSVEKLKKNTL